jgi:hypothetical protein
VDEQRASSPEDNEQVPFIEPHTHSFILKLWLLKQEGAKGKRRRHGHLTHVASNQRINIASFLELNNSLAPYLEKMGVKLPLWWRAYRWLKH